MPELKSDMPATPNLNNYNFDPLYSGAVPTMQGIPNMQQRSTPPENPLRQYFRRAAIHFRLKSGDKFYPPTVVQYPPTGELPVFPMTAIDEITSKTPDAAFNGSAVTDIIKSCVPSIIDPWALTTIDLDAVLIAIRIASVGETMEIVSHCPSCDDDYDYGINLTNVLQELEPADYNKPFVLDKELEIKFTPIQFSLINEISQNQFTIQKTLRQLSELPEDDVENRNNIQQQILKQLNELNIYILAKSIEWIRTPQHTVTEPQYIEEFLRNCQKSDFDKIAVYNSKLRESTQIKPLKVKCTGCNHEYPQPYSVNPSDFFD